MEPCAVHPVLEINEVEIMEVQRKYGLSLFLLILLLESFSYVSATEYRQQRKVVSSVTVVYALKRITKGEKIGEGYLQEMVINPSNGPFNAIQCRNSAVGHSANENIEVGQILLKNELNPPIFESINQKEHRFCKHSTSVTAERNILKGRQIRKSDLKEYSLSAYDLPSNAFEKIEFVVGGVALHTIRQNNPVLKTDVHLSERPSALY